MARAGLGPKWSCLFANDFDPKKGAAYAANWGSHELVICDVAALSTGQLPEKGDLAWASFPCQDLSLAGSGAGLSGKRSGAFWPFWNLVTSLVREDRAPELIVLENVCGTLSAHQGRDFSSIASALVDAGYRFGALVMDAVRFVPQSRPRLFIVATRQESSFSQLTTADYPDPVWHPGRLIDAYEKLSYPLKSSWLWWQIAPPERSGSRFADLIEEDPTGIEWNTAEQTERLVRMMSPINRRKVEQAKKLGYLTIGGVYKRTRVDKNGHRTQRAEVRFDEVLGCLRTPAGGSSRQSILVVNGDDVRSRLLSPREAARLMGLPDSYVLPTNYNEAYHLVGDGVVVPVVRFLATHLLEPVLAQSGQQKSTAA